MTADHRELHLNLRESEHITEKLSRTVSDLTTLMYLKEAELQYCHSEWCRFTRRLNKHLRRTMLRPGEQTNSWMTGRPSTEPVTAIQRDTEHTAVSGTRLRSLLISRSALSRGGWCTLPRVDLDTFSQNFLY
ncbi:unnamed protein product [Oncorhynchus mykiss]|uniref:Uncharacterized protein n=1 Tax=Oncorhynchus mykiss TaxID=8022 RepID=A0A060X9E4_ONCMY|nr:unnamed protein product [Oncorhynchus mykiss]